MTVNLNSQEMISTQYSQQPEADKLIPIAAEGMGSLPDLSELLKAANEASLNIQMEDRAYFELSLGTIQKDFPSLSIQKIGENALLVVNPTPALKTIQLDLDDYKEVEDLKKKLETAVSVEKEKPLVLVVDCENSAFNNAWLQQLLKDLHKEIAQGAFILIQVSSPSK